ncbi:c-type cytochrome biogenesis protein [Reinekea sp. MED297]|uniref:C-type cytochrome biogenesis protein n=2 Tax=Reinekea TaxID=230494 RepID=A4BFE6_9GAMM|nr:c-type cytochrome biogenesis protein [Reinekea sp. MED297] [Reinekea blandensis MED297]
MLASSLLFADEFLDVDDAFSVNVQRVGDSLTVEFDIAPDYYLYRDRYSIRAQGAADVTSTQFGDNVLIKYDPNFDEDMAVFYDVMSVRHAVSGAQEELVQLTYQGCADAGLCYPPQKRLFDLNGNPVAIEPTTLSLDLSSELSGAETLDLNEASNESGVGLTLISATLFALIGGLILNLMPCVFPVLSLKVMQMTQFGDSPAHTRLHGLAYTVGVVVSFLVVASVLLLIRYFGDWVGWGFQLQSPYFVAALVLLFFVMSLTMFGFVEFGQSMMGIGQGLTEKSGMAGSFFTGVLATVVATPCTAPFMGSAIGFALLQPAYVSLLIFAAMGLGLSLPVLLISLIPKLAGWMPKPGAWMTTFRQLMAFPLFATALWLLWVLIELQGTNALLQVGLGLILLTMALWPALSSSSAGSTGGRWFKRTVRVALVVTAGFMVFDQRQSESLWQEYSPELVQASLSEGRSVFVDVTAAWCITCKANERVALSGERFESLVEREDVVLIKADWTNPSPSVDQLIAGFNRDGVPLYAFYEKGSPVPEILPQILTANLIEEVFTGS